MIVGSGQMLIVLIYAAIIVVPFWKIFPRSGWHPALSLLMLIPIVNFILLWILAFKQWPGDEIDG